jgi:predicted dehydrogenase
MIDASPVKLGLIGAGAIAQAYGQALSDCPQVELAGVADVRQDAAQALADRFSCPSFNCYQEMVARTECEGAIVCTPPSSHPEICIWLLNRDLHVLCEKPLAIDVPSARSMLAAAEDAGVVFTMASKFRYVDDVVRAKQIIDSGTLGEVLLFENSFTGRVDMTRRWNSDPAISGGGVLIDNGTHSADIIRYFLGPLATLQVVEGKRHQNLAVEDTVRIFVRTKSDIMGSIDLSWSMNKELPNFISIYGCSGTLLVGWKESKYRRQEDQQWTVFGNGYDKLQAFRNQIRNFAGAIRGREPLRITPQDAMASVEVIDAAYAALKQTRWQRVGVPSYATTVEAGSVPAQVNG